MIEQQILGLITGNLVGVAFGLLMYRMATSAIKDNTKALQELVKTMETQRAILRSIEINK